MNIKSENLLNEIEKRKDDRIVIIVFAGEKPDETVLDHRRRIENCNVIVLVAIF